MSDDDTTTHTFPYCLLSWEGVLMSFCSEREGLKALLLDALCLPTCSAVVYYGRLGLSKGGFSKPLIESSCILTRSLSLV